MSGCGRTAELQSDPLLPTSNTYWDNQTSLFKAGVTHPWYPCLLRFKYIIPFGTLAIGVIYWILPPHFKRTIHIAYHSHLPLRKENTIPTSMIVNTGILCIWPISTVNYPPNFHSWFTIFIMANSKDFALNPHNSLTLHIMPLVNLWASLAISQK